MLVVLALLAARCQVVVLFKVRAEADEVTMLFEPLLRTI